MKTIITSIFLFLFVYCYAQLKNPYKTLKYDKVVFYDFEIADEKGLVIVNKDGSYEQSIIKQVQLDKLTISKINNKLGDKKSFGGGQAACFDPHCGFVYYFKNKVLAQITICLGCNGLYSTIDIPAQQQGKQGKGKGVYYMLDGMSKSFRKFINELLKKYKFSHQIEKGSSFDK